MLARFPAHAHRLSPVLTLQGAVAHCDMPLETGPTLYLPYLADLRARLSGLAQAGIHEPISTEHRIQLPLEKGDAVFFNPALFHAAGSNRTGDVKRIANLLQVSSAYGRAMESVDRTRMSAALYPALLALGNELSAGGVRQRRRRLRGGLFLPHQSRSRPAARRPRAGDAGPAHAKALAEKWPAAEFGNALAKQAERRLT